MNTRLLVFSAAALTIALAACTQSNPAGSAQTPAPETTASQPKKPASPYDGNEVLKAVFPDANAVKSIPLDYDSFAFIDNSGLAAVPLPPFLKQATIVHAMPTAGGYVVTAGSDKCENKILVKEGAQVLATLDPKDPNNKANITVDPQTAQQGKDLGIWLEDGAKVNYNCVIHITPVK